MPDGRQRGVEVGALESSRCGETRPSGGVINLGLLFDPAPQGLTSSGFLDQLLIRLLVKNSSESSYSTGASDLMYVYAHPENEHTNTSTHHNASVTHSDVFLCPAAESTAKSCLMRHQGLSSCHIKWDWDTHAHTTHTHYTITLLASFCHTRSHFIHLNLLFLPTRHYSSSKLYRHIHSLCPYLSFSPCLSRLNVSVFLPVFP